MATLERQIVEALVAVLEDCGAVADRVYEERGFTIPAGELPAVDVMVEGDDTNPEDLVDDVLGHALRVEVAVLQLEALGESAHRVADPIVAEVHRAVMRATTFPAAVRAITPGATRIARQTTGDGVVMRRAMTFVFDFETAVDDLEASP